MKELVIIGLLVILLHGCTHVDIPEEWLPIHQTATNKNWPVNRKIYPLTYARKPEIFTITPMSRLNVTLSMDAYRLKKLRHQGISIQHLQPIPPALHAPVTSDSMDNCWPILPVEALPFSSMITLSPEQYIQVQLENDIFNYTDRFFTNGIQVDLISPFTRYNPLAYLMIPYWHQGIDYYGIRIVQNIYTPSTTKKENILPGDRPYAGYLFVGTYKISNDTRRKFRLERELQLGIIGPSSLGGALQISFHSGTPQNDKPLGWELQIQNDLLLNYTVMVEKGIVTTDAVELNLKALGSLGTVYTHLQGGLFFRSGWFNPYFSQLFFSKQSINRQKKLKNIQCYLFFNFSGQLTGYDATLEGGLFNRGSPYTISTQAMNRILFQGSTGLVFSIGGIQIKGQQFLLSPEFQNGWWHKWMSLSVTAAF